MIEIGHGDVLPVDGVIVGYHIIFVIRDPLAQGRQSLSCLIHINHAVLSGHELVEAGIIRRLGHLGDIAPADIEAKVAVPAQLQPGADIALHLLAGSGIPDAVVEGMLQAVHGIHIRAPAEEPLKELRLDARVPPGKVVEDRLRRMVAIAAHIVVKAPTLHIRVPARPGQHQSRRAQDQHRAGKEGQQQRQKLEHPMIVVFHLIASIL